ncbi:hypothetical protein PFZ55_58190, partial [Streptomyces sp. MS2A]|nr:hypothetical protein [Streptomyces sp. MS2A]
LFSIIPLDFTAHMGACCVNQMKLAFFIAISARPFPGMRHDRAFSVDKVFRLPDRLLEFSFGKVFLQHPRCRKSLF